MPVKKKRRVRKIKVIKRSKPIVSSGLTLNSMWANGYLFYWARGSLAKIKKHTTFRHCFSSYATHPRELKQGNWVSYSEYWCVVLKDRVRTNFHWTRTEHEASEVAHKRGLRKLNVPAYDRRNNASLIAIGCNDPSRCYKAPRTAW